MADEILASTVVEFDRCEFGGRQLKVRAGLPSPPTAAPLVWCQQAKKNMMRRQDEFRKNSPSSIVHVQCNAVYAPRSRSSRQDEFRPGR